MKRHLFILAAVISLFMMACNGAHDQPINASAGSNLSGSSAVKTDSLRTIGNGATGQNPSTTGTDTVINGHLVTADSAKKIKL